MYAHGIYLFACIYILATPTGVSGSELCILMDSMCLLNKILSLRDSWLGPSPVICSRLFVYEGKTFEEKWEHQSGLNESPGLIEPRR